MLKLWHYTTTERFRKIMLSGYIEPSPEFKRNPSPTRKRLKSPIWLSSNEVMEPAVNKPVMANAGMTTLSIEEFHRQFGIVRIQLKPSSKVMSVHRLMRAIGLPEAERKLHLDAAITHGANPAEWYGIIGRVKIQDIVDVDRYVGNGKWESWSHVPA